MDCCKGRGTAVTLPSGQRDPAESPETQVVEKSTCHWALTGRQMGIPELSIVPSAMLSMSRTHSESPFSFP